ncbi:MAG TPA: S-methyl-5'-thioadenosine phosphorylase [Elusimicrobiota bacterium]|nr:S-methyl-5'-thioadenosine phosphorylase [Elusimicrobiota bacterium]
MTRAKTAAPRAPLGFIGGSGLYRMTGLLGAREIRVKTPYGAPSGPVVVGELSGTPCAFLARHGQDHVFLPSEINYRANIYALKSLGVERLIGVAAVGSLKEELAPKRFVFPDQLVDETKGRPSTFFGGGVVAHVAFAHPFCAAQSELLASAAAELGLDFSRGGTYVCMEGPQFSTRAESDYHRRQGYDVIGMTAAQEAKLAREAEICYSLMAMVTDYDCWKEDDEVTSDKVMATLSANAQNAQKILQAGVGALAARTRICACQHALAGALVTDARKVKAAADKKLALIAGKYLQGKK